MKKIILLLLMVHGALFSMAQDLEQFDVKKGLKVSGGLSFNNTFYSGSDSLIHRDPYMYTLSGNLNFNLLGIIDAPFSFAVSNTSKTYTQPFNRFQFAPKYKWVKLYLGTTNMHFSQYTLAGHDARGVGVELTPGHWNVSAMYGRFKKAIEYNPDENNIYDVAYKRMGYGLKVGYCNKGTDANVILFSAKDDKESLEMPIPEEADLHPQKNMAVSAYFRQKFLKHFFVQGEYALSLYNSELRASNGEEIESANFIDRVFGRKGNDRFVDALNASLGYEGAIWGLSFCYERVAPDYQTLGGYYFTNDVETFTLAPYLKLIGGKLSMSGKFGLERNNLNDLKADDTRRMVGSANVSFSSKGFTTSVSYSNFSTYTRYRKTAYPYYVDDLDSLNFYQINQSLNAMASYNFGKDTTLRHNISVMASYQASDSKNDDVKESISDIVSASVSYGQSLLPQNFSFATFFSINHATADLYKSLYYGPGVSCTKQFFDKHLTTGLSFAFNENILNDKKTNSLLNSSLSASYLLHGIKEKYGRHTFSASAGLTNRLKTEMARNYEFLATIRYGITF